MGRTKYPVEVASVVRKNKTLGFNSFLCRANSEEDESPYKIYGKFSRFTVTLIDTTEGDKKYVTGNIRVQEIADIERRSQYAFEKHMAVETKSIQQHQTSETGNSPAYTVKIASGKLKGKTPAQAINENNGKLLLEQRKFLLAHLKEYPNNQIQISAIEEACMLYKKGQLHKTETNVDSDMEVINLYNAGMHPLIRKTRQDGKCFVYEIQITWKIGAKYPVNVTVMNYYAKAMKKQDGRLNVNEIDEKSRIKITFSLSEAEWFNILSSIEKNMRQFEVMTAKIIFNDAQQSYSIQIRESKQSRFSPKQDLISANGNVFTDDLPF